MRAVVVLGLGRFVYQVGQERRRTSWTSAGRWAEGRREEEAGLGSKIRAGLQRKGKGRRPAGPDLV